MIETPKDSDIEQPVARNGRGIMGTTETEQPAETDAIHNVLMEHQPVSTLTDKCSCGAGDLGTLLDTGEAMRAHRRHLAELLTEQVAQAWDECAEETYFRGWMHDHAYEEALHLNPHRATLREQPYRSSLPGEPPIIRAMRGEGQ